MSNPNDKIWDSCKGRIFAALVLGLGTLDSAMHLTQNRITKELAQALVRRGYLNEPTLCAFHKKSCTADTNVIFSQ